MNFYDTFVDLCKRVNKSPSKVAEELGLSRAAVTKWKKGSTPNTDILKDISHYFGVGLDKFDTGITEEDKELAQILQICKDDPDIRTLFLTTPGVTVEEIKDAIKLIKQIRESRMNGL